MKIWRKAIGVVGMLAIATPALAHPGHAGHGGFEAGLLHPLTGLDHLLVMVLVGLWAGLAFGRRGYACPAAFAGFTMAGFGWARMGGGLPFGEMLIVGSLAAIGLALLSRRRPPMVLALVVTGGFAIAHGYAHGVEMPTDAAVLPYGMGMALSTAALLLAGLGLARMAGRLRRGWPAKRGGALEASC